MKKYFLYAIGEIILVVIGILIAFQIDNQAEEKIINARMESIFDTIEKDLKSDINEGISIEKDYNFYDSLSTHIILYGVTKKEFLDDPYLYTFPARIKYTLNITRSGYDNLIRNINHVPSDLDSALLFLHYIHNKLYSANYDYERQLKSFTWNTQKKWSEKYSWYYKIINIRLFDTPEIPEDAILYFTSSFEYKNLVSEFRYHVGFANIVPSSIQYCGENYFKHSKKYREMKK